MTKEMMMSFKGAKKALKLTVRGLCTVLAMDSEAELFEVLTSKNKVIVVRAKYCTWNVEGESVIVDWDSLIAEQK